MLVEKLLSIGSQALASTPSVSVGTIAERSGTMYLELDNILAKRNGFYAFEGALHVRHAPAQQTNPGEIGLAEWNTPDLWKFEYENLTEGIFFFAEDVFGVQFGIHYDRVVAFEPESGEIKDLANSIEEWVGRILNDYRQLTGFPIAHEWQQTHGTLHGGMRLLPKIPFILGGKFEVSNLIAVEAVKGMRYRGELWRQLRDLPDGAQVRLKALP